MKSILRKINENNMSVVILMLLPALFVVKTFELAYLTSLIVALIIILSRLIISLFKKKNLIIHLVIIMILVSVSLFVLEQYLPSVFNELKVYLPIITLPYLFINYNSEVKVKDSLIVSGSLIALLLLTGLLIEVLGNNTFTLINLTSEQIGYEAVYSIYPKNNILPIDILLKPAGVFILVGVIIGILNKIKGDN